MYARYPVGKPSIDHGNGLTVRDDAVVDFTTFFNAFSHRKWIALAGLRSLSIRFAGSGEISVTLHVFSETGAAHVLGVTSLTLSERGTILAVPSLADLPGELLGFHVRGIGGPATLTSAAWMSADAARRDVRLAAVITTFGREAAVRRAMDTFSTRTCRAPNLGQIELLVIDNGRALPPSTLENVTIFPNPNLGGAGGFARGLAEAMDAKRFTHALFMDDDASCEPESVWRTVTLLAYMRDAGAAIAGAMLLENRPCIQHEKGGHHDRTGALGYTWRSNGHYYDLSELVKVCQNEDDTKVNYGAWWFFAFPLTAIKAMPFPFFVRGDDVDFSLSNDLRIVTLNGIATWSGTFAAKLDPATEYLAYRGWMAVALIHGSKQAAFLALWNTLRVAQAMSFRFDYGGMNAVIDGIEDAMRGPAIFASAPAPIAKLKGYKALRNRVAFDLRTFGMIRPQAYRSKTLERRAKLTFGGNLAIGRGGDANYRHSAFAHEIHREGLLDGDRAAFGEGTEIHVLERDRRSFFLGKWRMNKVLWMYRFRLLAIQAKYRLDGPAIRTRAFWDPLFAGARSARERASSVPPAG